MALQGNLEELPFTDLLAIITRKEQSGTLRLTMTQQDPPLEGRVLVRRGQLFTAFIFERNTSNIKTRLFGDKALHALMVCPAAEFTFELLEDSAYNFSDRNVFSSAHELMLAQVFEAEKFVSFWEAGMLLGQPKVAVTNSLRRSADFPLPHRTTNPLWSSMPPVTKSSYEDSIAQRMPASPSPLQQALPATAPALRPVASPLSKTQRGWIGSLITRIRGL